MSASGTARSFCVQLFQTCVCVLFFTATAFAQPAAQKLHKHVPSVVANGRAPLVGAVSPSQSVRMSIVLPVRNQSALTQLLSDIYNPASQNYRHFLTVQQFTDQFGPSEQDYASLIQWAKDNGFNVDDESKNRMILEISGTAG